MSWSLQWANCEQIDACRLREYRLAMAGTKDGCLETLLSLQCWLMKNEVKKNLISQFSRFNLHDMYSSELEMEIMAFGNSIVLFWGLEGINDYCSIVSKSTLSSSLKRCGPSNQTLQTPRNVSTASARCQLCQAGSIESGSKRKIEFQDYLQHNWLFWL